MTDQTGEISGSVTDESGMVLPGVGITAVSDSLKVKYHTFSDSRGEYRMASARAGGPYAITAILEGTDSREKKGLYVKADEDLKVDFVLNLP